jgi:predicted ATP-dependent endonuclease of OLD family
MPILNINNFSCLKKAKFKLSPINVIIGPQGSGKSVTTKLFYFFSEIISNFIDSAEKNISLEKFKLTLTKDFCNWFPPPAWGKFAFKLHYKAGAFEVIITREEKNKSLTDNLVINFSPWFEGVYDAACKLFSTLDNSIENINDREKVQENIEAIFRVKRLIRSDLIREIGRDNVLNQIYIPAGRAFITSLTKLISSLEQNSYRDPITIKFAQTFANIRDFSRSGISLFSSTDSDNPRNIFMHKLFDGEIKFEGETEFLETTDGRKIPFSSLSSGQQELLPMWTLLGAVWGDKSHLPKIRNSVPSQLTYIEEPETHLFPSAQSALMDYLISSSMCAQMGRKLLLTTHSPYILGKLNIFLKAGQLSKNKNIAAQLQKIVPEECWIDGKNLSAYSIMEGKMESIFDEEGLLNAEYLDGISNENSRIFSDLLALEAEA